MKGQSRVDPGFEHIDRRLAWAFLALAASLMVVIFFVGAALYVQDVRQERRRLAEVIGGSLGPSFEIAKRAGEYRMEQLARQMREKNPDLEYIRVVDRAQGVHVQVGAADPSLAQDDLALIVRLTGPEGTASAQHVWEREGPRGPVIEVARRIRGGYQGEWQAVLRIGLRAEPQTVVLARAGGILGGVLALLLLAAWPVVRGVSRRLARPIRALARDFEGVMQHAPLFITIEDEAGRVEKASAEFREAFGLSAKARPPIRSLFPADVLELDPSPSPEVELEVNGARRVLLTTRFPVSLSESGEVKRAGLVAADVTAWRAAQAQADRLAAAVEHADDQILITDPEGGVVYVNPAFCAATGYAAEGVQGASPLALLFAEAPEDETTERGRQAVGRALAEQGRFRGRVEVVAEGGCHILCDLLVSPISATAGHVWIARDVRRESQLEQQLRQSQKMEAIGRLAGGVAHDFNNLLTVINGVAALMLEEGLEAEQRENVEMVASAGRRAAELTRQLLAFSRRQVLELREIDLNGVVKEALPLLESAVGRAVDLHFSPQPDLWVVRADVGQVEQVLMNLAINAKDAMEGGGRIRISTENATLEQLTEADGTVVSPGDYVVLTVADSGEGIDDKTLPKIFEPFFTTKKVGQGTGLGLATVHGIVRQSGGHVFVYSTPGIGTTFRLAFPRVFADEAPTGGEVHEAPPGGGERILVVDDDPHTRAVLEKMLERAGYAVQGASSGPEALEWLEGQAEAPRLVLTDIVMPKMSGVELAEVLAARHPKLPVRFVSGYSADALDFGIDPGRIVQKPPSRPALLSAVHAAIAGED